MSVEYPLAILSTSDDCGKPVRRGQQFRRLPNRLLSGPYLTGQSGTDIGFQSAIVRAHSSSSVASVMPGNNRRSSIATDNSPPPSKSAQIALSLDLLNCEHPASRVTLIGTDKAGPLLLVR